MLDRYIINYIHIAFENTIRNWNDHSNYGLLGGKTGALLFIYHYLKVFNPENYAEIFQPFYEEVRVHFEKESGYKTFANGLIGFTWLVIYLDNVENNRRSVSYILNQSLLSSLEGYVRANLLIGNYDYMHGGLGAVLVFLEAKKSLACEKAIDLLSDIAISDEKTGGLKWYLYTNGHYYKHRVSLGLSHGIPSIISVLVYLCTNNIKRKECQGLITESASYILSLQQEIPKSRTYFPYHYLETAPTISSSRLGWCYGDLGVGYVLLKVATLMNDENLYNHAITILGNCINPYFKKTNVVDEKTFCHGSCGIAYMFHKVNKATGNSFFSTEAEYWLTKTVENQDTESLLPNNNISLLDGWSGIGLSLLTVLYDIPNDWDHVFLL